MSKDNQADKDSEEFRPLSLVESEAINKNFSSFVNAAQIFFNSLQRNAATNINAINLHNKSALNFSVFTNGLSSKLLQQGFVVYPCLSIRKILQERDSPQFVINLSTAFADTTLGVPLEVNALLKTMKLLGVEIARKDIITATAKAFAPFFCRDFLSWSAINSNANDSLVTKFLYGVGSGTLTTPINNIGILVVENSPNKTWEETWKATLKKVCEKPKILSAGWKVRPLSIGASSIILSAQTTEFLTKEIQKIFADNSPSFSPKGAEAKKVMDSKVQRTSK
ncbi:MAG: hypothetical protein EBS06_06660 [Proteobacteria bacterium]|nr:hypothetical protein [Pseudomonadota bacterium]